MRGMSKGIMRTVLGGVAAVLAIAAIGAGTSMASEPSLLIYPNKPTIFRYDPARYELVRPSDPEFNTLFSVSGVMLWDMIEERVPHEVYRAPQLVGFEPSPYGMNEFVLMQNEFNIIVDGYSDSPRTFANLYMRFIPEPSHSVITLILGRESPESLIVPLDDLAVSTPTGDGHYADTRTHHLGWSGAVGLRITVYSDKDNDRVYSGNGPQFSIYVEDNTVATEKTSWGEVKARYRDM